MDSRGNLFEKSISNSIKKYIGERDHAEAKKDLIRTIADTINSNSCKILQRSRRYLDLLIESLKTMYGKQNLIVLKAKTASRLIVDVSSPMGWLIDEIGLAWDRILDTPYIPASSIKGAVRAVFDWHVLERITNNKSQNTNSENSDPLKKLKEIDAYLFGSQDRAGLLTFFDAYPIKSNSCRSKIVEPDVITPIYAKTPKEHEVSPTPAYFLAIAPGVIFKFLVLIRGDSSTKRKVLEKISYLSSKNFDSFNDFIVWLLKDTLTVWGLGAKTSSGYGIFKEVCLNPC